MTQDSVAADTATAAPAAPLLVVEDVATHFDTDRGLVRAVDGVSFTLERGKTLGIVGESGSGKTVLSRSIMGLLPKKGVVRHGSIKLRGDGDRRTSGPSRCASTGARTWRWSSRTR